MMTFYIGIDPGVSGAIAAVNAAGEVVASQPLDPKKTTEKDQSDFLADLASGRMVFARLEKVASSPQMGVRSAFTFGRSYGFLCGLLTAHGIPYEFITPAKWQQVMGCRTKGDKNITKAAAQRRWPSVRITHANADALLLAEFCRQSILMESR